MNYFGMQEEYRKQKDNYTDCVIVTQSNDTILVKDVTEEEAIDFIDDWRNAPKEDVAVMINGERFAGHYGEGWDVWEPDTFHGRFTSSLGVTKPVNGWNAERSTEELLNMFKKAQTVV